MKTCDVFDKLPELENDLAMDTKMALFHIAGYIVRKEVMIFSVMKNMVTLPMTSIVVVYKFLEILLVNGYFIVIYCFMKWSMLFVAHHCAIYLCRYQIFMV